MKNRISWKNYHPIFQFPFMVNEDPAFNLPNFAENYIRDLFGESYRTCDIPAGECDYLFFTDKFIDLIRSLKEKGCSIGIIGWRSSAIMELEIPFFSIFPWHATLYRLFKEDPQLSSRETKTTLDQFSNFFKTIGVKFLIVPNDSLILQRFLILCARMASVKTICIQHGLWSSKMDIRFLNGHFADYMFLWGESQKRLYSKLYDKKDLERKFKILGYPFETKYKKDGGLDKNKVCILGQNFEYFNVELGKRKKKIFENIANLLKRKGYTVMYKPHPGEWWSKQFLPENVEIFNRGPATTFRNFDIFIGLTSTMLLEASLNGKIAIQVYDENFGGDCFQEKGYSYTINVTDLDKLPDLIKNLDCPYSVSDRVIYRPDDVGERFLHLLKECE